ncbi:MAG TPA: MEDS domain-containing protein [Ramlibacter sp.]|nr:MEDS domain-containing protein [Ramlibacter sp.]
MMSHAEQGPHFVCFFDSESTKARSVAAYLASALRLGQPAVAIAKPALLEEIKRDLHRRHVEDEPFGPGRGKLVLLDAQEMLDRFCPDGSPDPLLFHTVVGSVFRELRGDARVVSAYGEMVGILCERGRHADALRLEGMWSTLLREIEASLFCGYSRALFDRPEAAAYYAAVSQAHTSNYDERTGFTPKWV